ncbi:lipopolysaccharide biosynthesis protein [Nitratireductor mangrovi]
MTTQPGNGATEPGFGAMDRISDFLVARTAVVRDYLTAVSGSVGRLVFSLLYFVVLANALPLADFGLFATASAAGVMLSRILGFGFVSALYRIATVKPLLLGVFAAGFLFMSLLSLPALALASWATHAIFFAADMPLATFAIVIIAEALVWRVVETIVIVNNGLNRFARAATLVIFGTAARALAAAIFAFATATPALGTWVDWYLAANAASLLVALVFFCPRLRLRLRPALYWRRFADSLYVAGAELLFYLQMEMDKLLVLAMGGPHLAGIYAIVMRLVDLTAIPIRTFTMLLVQKLMRTPESLARLSLRVGIEAAIFIVSTIGLLTLAGLLRFFPNLLGSNVAVAAPIIALALAVPGLRNLIEYQAELLFARGQMLVRAINLALLAAGKAVILAYLLMGEIEAERLVNMLNGAFLALYLISAVLTYSALRLPARRA